MSVRLYCGSVVDVTGVWFTGTIAQADAIQQTQNIMGDGAKGDRIGNIDKSDFG